ncbi:hypothetical protein [uncultured Thiodictyon sp.]|uniref:hypothetical protein n=1 Tax=uncultured Thiodictyon sp. TaxID=1846217 RepID=UPI0025DE6111|nr:hypothetical protein [uncultured Thiodictyon sp.]
MNTRSSNDDVITDLQYRQKTPDYYLATLAPAIRSGLTAPQLEAIAALLAAAIPQATPKLVDVRFSIDLLLSRFCIVLLVGKDSRRQRRLPLPESIVKIANPVAVIVLLVLLNLLISLFIFLLAYLVKSALGIDLFSGISLWDKLQEVGRCLVGRP